MIEDLPLVGDWDTYDWAQMFDVLDAPDVNDIEEVTHQFSTNSEEPDFVAIMRMKDDTWATVAAGHDYTGWDCQNYVRWSRHESLDDVITMGLTNESRRWLDLELP